MKAIIISVSLLISAAAIAMPSTEKPNSNEAVVLINTFIAFAGKEQECIAYWDKVADYMIKQDGFISTKLHQRISAHGEFSLINVAQWESESKFNNVVKGDEFQFVIRNSPCKEGQPALYQVIRRF